MDIKYCIYFEHEKTLDSLETPMFSRVFFDGTPTGVRTPDTLIKSHNEFVGISMVLLLFNTRGHASFKIVAAFSKSVSSICV